jgi:hypothetical protein
MGDDEQSGGSPAASVTNPYPPGPITYGAAPPAPGEPTEGANNALTMFVPTASSQLSIGGVPAAPAAPKFEFPPKPGFNVSTTECVTFEVGAEVAGHVVGDVTTHIHGKKEETVDDNWFDKKCAVQVEWVLGATQETYVGIKQESMLALKHELIVGGYVSHIFAYKNEFTTGWVNETINGPETKTTNGMVKETVNGNESKTVIGNSSENVIGNETTDITGTVEENVHGNKFENIYGNVQETCSGTKQEKFEGKWTCEGTVYEMMLSSNAQIKAVDMEFKASGGHHTEAANVESKATGTHHTEGATVKHEASGQLTAEGKAGAELKGPGAVTQIEAGSIKAH